jgi:hypothetical protein
MGHTNRQRQQPSGSAQVGRHVRTLPILTAADKIRIRVEADAKANERVREVEKENARLRRERQYDALAEQNREIVDLRIDAMKLTPVEAARERHVLQGALSRHKSKGLPLKDFDPHAILNEDAVRHGKALPLPEKNASPMQLPPPNNQEGLVLPHDRAGILASQQPYAARSAAHREQELKAREQTDEWYRKHPGLQNPALGSTPGDWRGGYGT